MRILIDVTHPAHVHFFRNAAMLWNERGHRVCIASRRKDLTVGLLDNYEFGHRILSTAGTGTAGLGRELAARSLRLLRWIRREHIDIAVAIGGTFVAPAARLARVPAVVFTDTEHATVANAIAFFFADLVVTPDCYRGRVRGPHLTYPGYHELAYLHPARYTPDESVLEQLGVAPGEPYAVLRFVGWGAAHDAGHRGIAPEMKRRAVKEFEKFARVFITSEAPLPDDLEPYRTRIPPERMHDALAFATLLYGESATMASECAVLGTPAIFLDDSGRGYTDEQERVYGAVFNFTESLEDQERSIRKGLEILRSPDARAAWREKRSRLLADKVDLTAWIVERIERLQETL